MSFIFDKLAAPPPLPKICVLKYTLNHFLVYFSAKDSLRSAKNVVFSLFCLHFGQQASGGL